MIVGIRPGGWGWVGLGAFVTVVDSWLIRKGYDTMSTVWGDSAKDPRTRWPLLLVWAIISLHLFSVLLPASFRERFGKYDPIGWVAEQIAR